MNEKFLTIFTPTFNRGYVLKRLYDSLCNQTDKGFEWIIVDDGSKDNTEELVQSWILENKIHIRYLYQKNSGKSQAHNLGVSQSNKEFFTCVDSDDFLTINAVEELKKICNKAKNMSVIGIVCKRGDLRGKSITSWKVGLSRETFFRAQKKYALTGDTMLIWKTKVLKTVEFPLFVGEKFIPEGYLYDRLSQIGECLFVDKVLYKCEYLPDGYTASMRQVNTHNPHGYQAYIQQRLRMDFCLRDKFLDSVRYVAIKCVIGDGKFIQDAVYPFITILALIPGYVFFLKSYKNT